MKRVLFSIVCLFVIGVSVAVSVELQKHSDVPPNGFVPDKETAMRIAEAVWIPIYGEDHIQREKPFRAGLKNGVWTVIGSLAKGKDGKAAVGGVAMIEIAKSDGRILSVNHGR